MSYLINIIQLHLATFNFFNLLDSLDLLVAAFFFVATLVYLKRFPVFRVVLGTLFLLACSFLFLAGGFIFTALLFGGASSLILISLPLIFAPEVRHYLEKLGRFPFLKMPAVSRDQRNEVFIRNLVGAVYELAEKKTGALIILQRATNLGHLIESGIVVDAKFGAKLLENIFFQNSPLHDGAVVIGGERIIAARCTVASLPEVKLDPPLGQRHKAGLSATKETDAIAVIVSEQRGEVSLAENGKLEIGLPRAALVEKLAKLLI